MVLVFHIQRRFWEGNKVFFLKKEGVEKKDGWKKEIKLPQNSLFFYDATRNFNFS